MPRLQALLSPLGEEPTSRVQWGPSWMHLMARYQPTSARPPEDNSRSIPVMPAALIRKNQQAPQGMQRRPSL